MKVEKKEQQQVEFQKQKQQNTTQMTLSETEQSFLFEKNRRNTQEIEYLQSFMSDLQNINKHISERFTLGKNSFKQEKTNIDNLNQQIEQLRSLIALEQVQLESQNNKQKQKLKQYFCLTDIQENSVKNLQKQEINLQNMFIKAEQMQNQTNQYKDFLQNIMTFQPILELYSISFDRQYAYVNGEAITWNNLHWIFEIMSLLAQREQLIDWKYSRNDNIHNIAYKNVSQQYNSYSQTSSISALNLMTLALADIWQKISKKIHQKIFIQLPFPIKTQPIVTVKGVQFKAINTYHITLKNLINNLHFITTFDQKKIKTQK